MIIERIVSDLLESNMYIVLENGRCILIDPCIKEIVNVKNVDYIFATHEHYDHISGVNYWKEITDAIFITSRKCAEMCKNPSKNLSRYFEAFCQLQNMFKNYKIDNIEDYYCYADDIFDSTITINWEGHSISIKECPGHSKGSCLIIIDNIHVFSGDSILENNETECGLPGGNKKDWEQKGIVEVRNLKGDMIVHPGHFEIFQFSDWCMNR